MPFHVDHVVARQHGGTTTLDNLTYCCADCNRHKGPNVGSVNPETGRRVRLFNPRVDRWDDHFFRVGSRLVGRTTRGRLTVESLSPNSPGLLRFRRTLMEQRLF